MAALDYKTKTITVSDPLNLSHDLNQDLKEIHAFYANKRGKFPELEAPIVLPNIEPDTPSNH